GVEPGAALAVADDGQDLGGVVGQVQLDGAERLDDPGDGGVEVRVGLAPGDVVAQVPAPFALRHVEEIAVEAPEGHFQFGVDGPKVGLLNQGAPKNTSKSFGRARAGGGGGKSIVNGEPGGGNRSAGGSGGPPAGVGQAWRLCRGFRRPGVDGAVLDDEPVGV